MAPNRKGSEVEWFESPGMFHSLIFNLVVTDAIKGDNELADLIEKVKAIVTFIHTSSKVCDNLTVNQNRLNLPYHKLRQHVEILFIIMLHYYFEQEEAIKTTLCLLDIII